MYTTAYEMYSIMLYQKRYSEKIDSDTYIKYMRKIAEWDNIMDLKMSGEWREKEWRSWPKSDLRN